jgi:hypothetical protein
MLTGEHAGKLHFADFIFQSRERGANFREGLFVVILFAKLNQNLQVLQIAGR